MPRPRHLHNLTARVVPVVDPDADASFDAVLDLLADALADLAIADARAEVAARIGVAVGAIDRERGGLDGEARAWLDATSLRSAA